MIQINILIHKTVTKAQAKKVMSSFNPWQVILAITIQYNFYERKNKNKDIKKNSLNL